MYPHLQIATKGIQMTAIPTSKQMRSTAQKGHSFISVCPLLAIQAGYPLPWTTKSTKLAVSINSIARGERYFQQTIQYKPGRLPVISSISSANLKSVKGCFVQLLYK